MSDRAILFLFSVIVVIACLATAVWLLITGQALGTSGTIDGLFLLLSCLVIAFAFALYLRFMIKRALAALQPAPTPAAKAAPAAAQQKTSTLVAAEKTE